MATAEELIQEKGVKVFTVSPDERIRTILETLVANNIGSIVVMEKNKVVGIWTERDLMRNILTEGFDINTARVGDFMTTRLVTARHSDPHYVLMDKFLGRRIRHLLIEKNGRFIGMLSIGDVVKSTLRGEFEELKKQRKETSWEYYEEWGWNPKNR